MMARYVAMLSVFAAVVALTAAQPFERYRTIIDRKPFGPEPVNFNPEAAPGSVDANSPAGEMTEEQRTVEEQQLAATVRVSMINITPAGAVAVGFTDTSASPPENHYIVVGRTQNGWTVKNADPSTESVTLEKGGVEVTVKLGETSGGGKSKIAKGASANRPMTLQSDSSTPGAQASAAALPMRRLGALARLRQQRAERQAKELAAAEKKKEAEIAAAEERAEREAQEAEEKRLREEREAREAEERAQQREALRQIQEQLRKEREARETGQRQEMQNQEAQGEANNIE